MDLPQLWAELESRWPESIIDPSLTRIVSVMELLGDPQRAYPVIQVAGTNGKTSTARMIESVLRAYGLRTGLFTSPHLVDARERIRLDGEPVTAERLLDTWNDIEPYVRLVDKNSTDAGGVPLSYFEVITSLAYAAFADAPVDV
ncbi:MAG: dihydrofolate synthase, partial [Actinomycetota bacterium]|nr:dihydrofolate synthase [Actinomycetota bacterium]